MRNDLLTQKIIGACLDVHKALGPGLLESSYEICCCHEFSQRGLQFKRQVHQPVQYKGLNLDAGYRLDVVIEDKVVLELKAVEKVLSIHEAQLLTYLKLGNYPIGLLINFNVEYLRFGIKRLANKFDDSSITK